jgi:two-component system copper resistance phosphate regulon response regulator CusR
VRVLVVEDQIAILQSLKKGLEENGFTVDGVSDGISGKMLAESNTYSVIILDVLLPGMNGIELCLHLRQKGVNTPIMFLSALDSVEDKVAGLDAGGDDYLAKPFSFEEVLARLRVLNRRNQEDGNANKKLLLGNLEINFDMKEAFREGKNLNLTKKEFRLLEYFVSNQGKVLTKSEIAEKVWDLDFDTGTNVVEVYVNYLRNKLDKGFEDKMIQTKFGLGYIFVPL